MGGLFSMFRGDKGDKMTPHLAFATALMYMMKSDGEMDNEEIGALLAVLGGEEQNGVIGVGANNRALLDKAQQYARRNTIETFVAEAAPLLSDAQRICVLINLIDMSFADGQPEPEEQVAATTAFKAAIAPCPLRLVPADEDVIPAPQPPQEIVKFVASEAVLLTSTVIGKSGAVMFAPVCELAVRT